MRKLFFMTLLLCAGMQQIRAQNRIGLIGGGLYAKSNLTNQQQGGRLFQSSKTFGSIYSFYGGIVYDIKVTNEFSIKTKLLYINKGWTEATEFKGYVLDTINSLNVGTVAIPSESIKQKETYQLSYLELPISFTFYTPVGKSLLSFGVGPYLSFGLSGRYTFQPFQSSKRFTRNYVSLSIYRYQGTYELSSLPGEKRDTTITVPVSSITTVLTDTNSYLANSKERIRFERSKDKNAVYTAYRFDYGTILDACLEFRNGLSISVAYTIGLTNVIKDNYGALQNRHRSIMLGLGYYVKRKRKS